MVTPVPCEGGSHGSADKQTAWEPEGPEYDSRQRQLLKQVKLTLHFPCMVSNQCTTDKRY